MKATDGSPINRGSCELILDLMPPTRWFEILRELQVIPAIYPIVIITSRYRPLHLEMLKQEPNVKILWKPVKPEVLAARPHTL